MMLRGQENKESFWIKIISILQTTAKNLIYLQLAFLSVLEPKQLECGSSFMFCWYGSSIKNKYRWRIILNKNHINAAGWGEDLEIPTASFLIGIGTETTRDADPPSCYSDMDPALKSNIDEELFWIKSFQYRRLQQRPWETYSKLSHRYWKGYN